MKFIAEREKKGREENESESESKREVKSLHNNIIIDHDQYYSRSD